MHLPVQYVCFYVKIYYAQFEVFWNDLTGQNGIKMLL